MRIRLCPPADLLAREDDALLLYEGSVLRLGPVGAAIVELAADGTDLDALTRALEDRFGAPPDGGTREATRAAVDDLIARGVLEEIAAPTTGGLAPEARR